jgi:hypothetical protein
VRVIFRPTDFFSVQSLPALRVFVHSFALKWLPFVAQPCGHLPTSLCCVELTHSRKIELIFGQIRQNQSWRIALASKGGHIRRGVPKSLMLGGTRELLKRSMGTPQE